MPRVDAVIGTCSVRKSLHCSTASKLDSLSTAVHASKCSARDAYILSYSRACEVCKSAGLLNT
eukprot:2153-Heterococcus_DN1.PRE.3